MEKYISKSASLAEIEKRRDAALARQHNLNAIGQETVLNEMIAHELNRIISSLDTLEVKDMSMPALDNGNMPVERWKEACEAASCQANYRKSKGLTETCDDYFVDGVQWADEHPKKVKEVDLAKNPELSGWVARDKDGNLHVFEVKPKRSIDDCGWWDRDYKCSAIDKNAFRDLKWEDEPVCVKLIIIKEE